MPEITVYSGSSGLNAVLDPQRLSQGTKKEPGIIELSQAVNIAIDERGLVTLRNGGFEEVDGEFHSIFCQGGDCFVVQERESDAAIMRVNADYSLTGVRSGLTKDRRMAWGQSGADTFYSNGLQTGYIRDGVSAAWPVQSYHGPDADMQFATAIPAASHIAFMMGGYVLLAVGNAIFANHSPFQYGLFHPARGNVASFAEDITMIAAVHDGFYASDGSRTWFFRRTDEWYQFKQEQVDDSGALEWSLAHDSVRLRDVNIDLPGFGRVWASGNGICIGTDDGTFINMTKEKIKYPRGYAYGACLLKDGAVIHTAW